MLGVPGLPGLAPRESQLSCQCRFSLGLGSPRVWLAVLCNFPCFSFLLFPFDAVARCIVRGSERRALTCIPSQTHPSTQSVQLIGSWDNFSQSYPMQRDVRRGRGQWRGCYSFRDIVCDDASVSASATCVGTGASTSFGSPSGSCLNKRHGGLQMGHTYYYYVCHSTLAFVCHSVSSHHPSTRIPHNKHKHSFHPLHIN